MAATHLRDSLKIVNRYVRDPEMSRVLRCNFLTQAANKHSEEKWRNTPKVLKRVFGIGSEIDGFTLQMLETYKSVESSKIFDKNTSPFKELG